MRSGCWISHDGDVDLREERFARRNSPTLIRTRRLNAMHNSQYLIRLYKSKVDLPANEDAERVLALSATGSIIDRVSRSFPSFPRSLSLPHVGMKAVGPHMPKARSATAAVGQS